MIEKPWPAGLTQELWNPKTLTLMSPIEIARQLTMIGGSILAWGGWERTADVHFLEQELFFKMRAPEFFGQAWLKPDKDVVSPNIVAAMKYACDRSYRLRLIAQMV